MGGSEDVQVDMNEKVVQYKRWGPLEFSPTVTIADLAGICMGAAALIYAFAGLSKDAQLTERRVNMVEQRIETQSRDSRDQERRLADKLESMNSKLDQLLGRESARSNPRG